MKHCPHCHEATFGFRELFTLDYFGPDECKSCGKLVRNDGLRQFLVIPATIVAVLLCIPLWSIVPDAMQPLFSPLGLVLILLPQLVLAKPVKAEDAEVNTSPFTPDRQNDKEILIEGWNEEEVRQIAQDFNDQDRPDLAQFKVEIHKRFEHSFRLAFPEDIPPYDFVCFVNYLAYPIDLNLAGRSIVVMGRCTLSSDLQGVPEALNGRKAIFYLAETDKNYDVVFMQTADGTTLQNQIGHKMNWRRVKRPRMGPDAKRLLLGA
jgi:hypothetical protein